MASMVRAQTTTASPLTRASVDPQTPLSVQGNPVGSLGLRCQLHETLEVTPLHESVSGLPSRRQVRFLTASSYTRCVSERSMTQTAAASTLCQWFSTLCPQERGCAKPVAHLPRQSSAFGGGYYSLVVVGEVNVLHQLAVARAREVLFSCVFLPSSSPPLPKKRSLSFTQHFTATRYNAGRPMLLVAHCGESSSTTGCSPAVDGLAVDVARYPLCPVVAVFLGFLLSLGLSLPLRGSSCEAVSACRLLGFVLPLLRASTGRQQCLVDQSPFFIGAGAPARGLSAAVWVSLQSGFCSSAATHSLTTKDIKDQKNRKI